MKIRERCICGAEFEIRSKLIGDLVMRLRMWQNEHACTQFRLASVENVENTETPA